MSLELSQNDFRSRAFLTGESFTQIILYNIGVSTEITFMLVLVTVKRIETVRRFELYRDTGS